MTLSRRFLLIFCGIVLGACLVTGVFAVYSLHQAYMLFTHATKPELIPLMAGKMFTKAVIGFCVACLFCIGIALPTGIYLLRQASRPYLFIFEHLSDIAYKRLQLTDESRLSEGVISTIKRFLELWRFDFEKLRDYEKEKEWKNGARMLLHELKNPLTPLKLSVQKLLLQKDGPIQEDLKTLATATADVENILACFKELVNIEFGPKEPFDAARFVAELHKEAMSAGSSFEQTELSSERFFPVVAEKALLKMVYVNLTKNGLDENSEDFKVDVSADDHEMRLDFVTPNRTIDNTSRIFKLGYSTKGDRRGFGLFLCKKISDYLDLDLKCGNRRDGVVFSMRLKKQG
jgi:signal transduction histidine kinase